MYIRNLIIKLAIISTILTAQSSLTLANPGITIDVIPVKPQVAPPGTATYSVNITSSSTELENVNLSIVNPKDGWTYSFSNNDFNLAAGASTDSELAITVPQGTASGDYFHDVRGFAVANDPDLGPIDEETFYLNVTTEVINVQKATPTIIWSNPADITYGTALSGTQLNAEASVPGSFIYNPDLGTILGADDNQTLHVDFTPTDTTNYTNASADVRINVLKATPTITWNNPANITFGIALSETQLDATASVPGSFVYNPANGTMLSAGEGQILLVAFIPSDSANYTNASARVTINVTKATPIITWNNPANITYGTALSSTQLDATASVEGTFTYIPSSGTILSAGNNQTLHVDFTSTDSTNYTTASKDVTINILKATPTITWNNPSDITYPTALDGTQLNAIASIPGSFTYTPASGTVLGAGNNQILHVGFTPSDAANYTDISADVKINILKATPTITWSNPLDITYGTPLGNIQLNAVASVPGSLVYTPLSGTVLGAGTQTLHVDLTPTDATNYTPASADVTINVLKATPIITWSDPTNITEGTALSSTQLNANASVPGSFVYTPSFGAVLSEGTQILHVDFIPTDTANYTNASKDVNLTVVNIAVTVTLDSSYFATIPITLRIAGQGAIGNSVALEIIQDGKAISSALINRTPGSPNAQKANLSATIDLSKNYSGRLIFDTGADISGGTPVWVIIDGNMTNMTKITTFNTQKNNPASYHQTFDFALAPLISIIGKELTFSAAASYPSSETLTFNWNFGDSGALSNSYPWPHAITVTDTVKHTYSAAGSYTISVNVTHGNGGEGSASKTVVVS